jgi:DNA-binding MarR family transcriptional regulator
MSSDNVHVAVPAFEPRQSWIQMARRKSNAVRERAERQRTAINHTQLERSALLAARTLVDRMRALYRELERMTDAPISMHRALTLLAEEPGITASRLAESLGMQRPAVSHVLRGLAERGWIERRRHADDQRSVRLHVSAAGVEILRQTGGRAVGTLQRAMRQLSREDLAGLAAGLNAVLVHLPRAPAKQHVRRYTRSRLAKAK